MFTFKPASKNGANGGGNSQGNGNHTGDGHGNGNGNGNGHSNGNGNGNGHSNGNGDGRGHAPLGGWLGPGQKIGNGNGDGRGHANGNGHTNGNENGHSNKIESVLGPGVFFKGNLGGSGGVRIEGTFDGSINIKGPLVVADGAKVTADIQAYSVSVAGSVQGNITANKVEIRATGRIFGDLVTTAFSTEEGAFLRGQVRMEDQLPAPVSAGRAPAPRLAEPASLEVEVPQPAEVSAE